MASFKKVLGLLIFSVIIGFSLLSYFGPRMIIEINNEVYQSLRSKNRSVPGPSDYSLQADSISFITSDGLKLKALLLKSAFKESKGTIVFVHGIRSFKELYLSACKTWVDRGYDCVTIDLRAHGQSEGKYCTFGYKEKYDISALVDIIYNDPGLSHQIGIWGQSLGAAIAMQSMSIDKRIKVGIIESTFSDFRSVVYDYASKTLGFRSPLLFDYLIWCAEKVGEFKADEIVPSESAKSITQPILMVHGQLDKRINIKYGLKNFKNLSSLNKEFITIPQGNHLNIWQVGGNEYLKKVMEFIDSNL